MNRTLFAAFDAIERVYHDDWRALTDGSRRGMLSVVADETADAYQFRTELPGIAPDDIDVDVHDTALTVNATVAGGKFQRTLPLPAEADIAALKIDYADDTLTLTLPRRTEREATFA